MDNKKSFGLTIPKKAKAFNPKISGVFGSDSDEDLPPKKKSSIPQSKPILTKVMKSEELVDPTIYEYDNIYDDIKAHKSSEIVPKQQKSSRYIDNLLKAADKRKKQYEQRIEKKVQNEREKEGDKFKDKEMFVTSGYKKKLQEREEEEERERRENQLNEMMDVTKQKDLSGFYRHFLKQSIGEEKIPVFGENITIKKEPQDEPNFKLNRILKKDTNLEKKSTTRDKNYTDEDDTSSEESACNAKKYKKSHNVRNYRKHSNSESSSEESNHEENPKTKSSERFKTISSHEKSSFNTNFEKSSKTGRNYTKNKYSEHSQNSLENEVLIDSAKKCKSGSRISYKKYDSFDKDHRKGEQDTLELANSSSESEKNNSEEDDLTPDNKIKKHEDNTSKKQSKNMYEKRLVGDLFVAAQARYFQRRNS